MPPPLTVNGASASTLGNRLSLDAQDGVRGLAALIVVLGHLLTMWLPIWPGSAAAAAAQRYPLLGLEYFSPVSLFFVISGFTLVTVYGEANLTTWASRRRFLWKRISRLAPVYYLALLVSLAPMLAYETPFNIAASVPISLLWLQAVTMLGNSWNGALWTVSAFAVCYLAFGPLLLRLRDLSDRELWRVAGALSFGSAAIAVVWIGVNAPLSGLLHIWAPFRLPQFAVGMCAGLLAQRHPVPSPTLVSEACTVLLVGSTVACALLTETYGPGAWFRYMLVAEFVLVPVHALWLASLAAPRCRGVSQAVLASRPARLLGSVSYALYCLHLPVLNFLAWAVAGHGLTASAVPQHDRDRRIKMGTNTMVTGWFAPLGGGEAHSGAAAIWPAVCTCLVAAAAAFVLVEEPARRALNAWAGAGRRRQGGGSGSGKAIEVPDVQEHTPLLTADGS